MSFDVICGQCGAPSGPSVGVCPFCKSVMAATKKDAHPTLTKIRNLYNEGKLESAVQLAHSAEAENSKFKDNVTFLLAYAKILLEVEGPTSKIKSLLTRAHMVAPENAEVAEYFDLIEAKQQLTHGVFATGEAALKSLLRRSPNNAHALFLLGSQKYHTKEEVAEAIRYLERCVHVRPVFLRAWGCLGAIYRQMGQFPLAERAFRKCLALETNPKMKEFFNAQLGQAHLVRAA